MNRQQAEKRGRGAETLACWYLRLRRWRILARRARVPGGEVDIVARRGRILAFVEVKARSSEGAAAFALDDWRLRRVAAAAERHATCAKATMCASMPCSASRADGRATSPMSG